VEFDLLVPRAGTYLVRAGFVVAEDYGIVDVTLNGRPLGAAFDAYSPRVAVTERALAELALPAGRQRVRLRVVGKNPLANGFFAGLDYLELEPRPDGTDAVP
jgi:hypothetical protein